MCFASQLYRDAPATDSDRSVEASKETNTDATISDITVTAQKRSQSVNTVPISITTATGAQLEKAGIREVNDLSKISSKLNEENASRRIGFHYVLTPPAWSTPTSRRAIRRVATPHSRDWSCPASIVPSRNRCWPYEAGFKLSLLDYLFQLNGAGFYYDYRDKQVIATIKGPVFGEIANLISVPKHRRHRELARLR